MRDERKHVSQDEMKKGLLMKVLIGVLIAIVLIIVIMFIPKGNNNENLSQASGSSTKGQSKDGNLDSEKNSNTVDNENLVNRDKTKVAIAVKDGTLTPDGAVIVITDTNTNRYTWTPVYRLQQKVDNKWEDMELKNPENAIFAEVESENKTGVMEQSLVWGNKYGSLETGTYRIVKESGGSTFYAVFSIQ